MTHHNLPESGLCQGLVSAMKGLFWNARASLWLSALDQVSIYWAASNALNTIRAHDENESLFNRGRRGMGLAYDSFKSKWGR